MALSNLNDRDYAFLAQPPAVIKQAEIIGTAFAIKQVKAQFFQTKPPTPKDPNAYDGFTSDPAYTPEPSVATSYLGTPVFTQIIFPAGEYQTQAGQAVSYPRVVLQTVLADVAMTRNIVTTPVQGADGTVKEYISDGDFAVVIKGALVNESGFDRPTDQVNDLISLIGAKTALPVVSDYLQMFGIHNLVIMDWSMPQPEGMPNTQPFELRCPSDKPLAIAVYKK